MGSRARHHVGFFPCVHCKCDVGTDASAGRPKCVCEGGSAVSVCVCVYVRPSAICTPLWRGVIEWWRTGLNTAGSELELLRDEQSASGSRQLSLLPLTNKAGGEVVVVGGGSGGGESGGYWVGERER